MFKPFYKIHDQRSIFKRIYYKCHSYLTGVHTASVPSYHVHKHYISTTTKMSCMVVILSVCGALSTAVYQTVYPSYNTKSTTINVTSTLESIEDHAPTTHGFPLATTLGVKPDNESLNYNQIYQVQDTKKQLLCLAKNMYFEARSEGLQGQLAVGLVTLNRVVHKDFPNNVCDVVWQDKQFSWTHDGQSDIPEPGKSWVFSKKIADFLLTVDTYNHIDDITGNATFYHANYVSPYWGKSYSRTVTVGLHLFYKHDKI